MGMHTMNSARNSLPLPHQHWVYPHPMVCGMSATNYSYHACGTLREDLFPLAHNTSGHFGADKSYATLCNAYYWPNMRRNLEKAYIPSCTECLCNKSSTQKPTGPLHPLL